MSIKRLALVVLLAACIGLILMNAGGAPGIYVYNVLSPKAERPQAPEQEEGEEGGEQGEEDGQKEEKLTELGEMLKSLKERLDELSGVTSAYGVLAYAPQTSLSDGASASVTALLKAQWGAKLHPDQLLVEGRQLYLEEIEQGTASAVIDDKLAIDLFRVGNPVGRQLYINGTAFTVVGIVRNSRGVGDREASSALVPLKALDKAGIQTKMLSVLMQPKAGAGAYAALSQGMQQWHAEGDFYSLPKEMYRVRLPLRLMLCALGLMLIALTLKLSGGASRAIMANMRGRIEGQYALRILPELMIKCFMILMMYVLNVAAIALVLQQLIAPVYIFPEWVPTILVEPTEIAKTFWTLRGQETGLVSLRTPELLKLKYLHRLMTGSCLGVFMLLLKPYYFWKKKLFGEG